MTHQFTADKTTAPAMAKAFLKWTYHYDERRRQIKLIALCLPLAVILLVTLVFQPDNQIAILALLSIVVVTAVLGTGIWAYYAKLKRILAATTAQPGAKMSVKVGAGQLTVTTATGTGTNVYSSYEGLYFQDSFVILKLKAGKAAPSLILPRQLFSDEDIGLIKAGIAQNDND